MAKMALGGPHSGKTSLGVLVMLGALVFSAFLGGALGLVWQSVSWFDDAPDETAMPAADDSGG
ncbi:MAG: hypothetical protein KDE15_06075 [Erythrobacter sp.]|nr:hypothetical protein [Erythrobacter sp.]